MDSLEDILDKLKKLNKKQKTLGFFLGKLEELRDRQLHLEGASRTLTLDHRDPKISELYRASSREDGIPDDWEEPSGMNLKRQHENDGSILECYNMDQSRKAFVMCVKNGRSGAEQDLNIITNWLEKCSFQCEPCIDPDKAELIEKLTEFRDEINGIKDGVSCCLVTLMAHGGKGYIRTKFHERVNLSDIFEMFNNKNCPALQEKPKIFVIQACRGVRRDGGVVVTDAEPMDLDSEKKRLPTFSDYYIIYSTQEDHVALRYPEDGSVMIQAIDEVFQQHGKKGQIVDFFTQVNNKVVHRDFYLGKTPVKVVLVMESTLTKAVYF